MALLGVLGVSDATLGLALALGWLAVLGVGLSQYRRGTRSRERFYMTVTVGGLWLAVSLLQVSNTFAGVVETGVVALAVAVFVAGVGTGVGWWRIRTAGTDESVR